MGGVRQHRRDDRGGGQSHSVEPGAGGPESGRRDRIRHQDQGRRRGAEKPGPDADRRHALYLFLPGKQGEE
ncbi:hypothetical protein D3C83_114470 [compost metagenome]